MIINNKNKPSIFLLPLMLLGMLYNCTPKAVSTEERFTTTETENTATIAARKGRVFRRRANTI